MSDSQSRPGEGDGASGAQAHGFGQRVDQIGCTAQQLWSEARGAASDLGQTLDLRGRVERHPYGMIAAAAGVGYVLGGGLFTPLTARILRLGLRLAALPFVKEELLGMAEAALNDLSRKAAAPGGPGSPGAPAGPGVSGDGGSPPPAA